MQYPGVVGIDLAGCPLSEHSWSMTDYAVVFQRAGEMGLGRTVHAGEGRPPEEIATAILDRILHHCVTVNIRGESYRLKEKLKAGLVKKRG